VPFIEHPLGPDYTPEFDPVTEDPIDEPDFGSIYYNESKTIKYGAKKRQVRKVKAEGSKPDLEMSPPTHILDSMQLRENGTLNMYLSLFCFQPRNYFRG
jgi:hypothetical protein